MRLLHVKENKNYSLCEEQYIVIDKIEKFAIFKIEDRKKYVIDVLISGQPFPIATNISNPQKIVQDLLNVINTIDNDIIEYTIKVEE